MVKPVSRSVPWITVYTTSEMREIQSCDPCLGKLIVWISSENYYYYYLGFYVAFNTVQVISRQIVGRAEETSIYSSLGFCTVNC